MGEGAERDTQPAVPAGRAVLSVEEADELTDRLGALTEAARVFGSGIAGMEVRLTWTLRGRPEGPRWEKAPDGSPVVSLRLALGPVLETVGNEDEARAHTFAFKAAFLRELGHILHTPWQRRGEARAAAIADRRAHELVPQLNARLGEPAVAELVDGLLEYLESARVERLLLDEFRGAAPFLADSRRRAVTRLDDDTADEVERLAAYVFLTIRDPSSPPMTDSAWVEGVGRAVDHALRAPLEALELAELVIFDLLPLMAERLPSGRTMDEEGPAYQRLWIGRPAPGDTQASDEGEQPLAREEDTLAGLIRSLEEMAVHPGLAPRERHAETPGASEGATPDSLSSHPELILYPHVNGSLVVDEIEVADAHRLTPTAETRSVLEQLQAPYGPLALEAFTAEAAALRRAFQVNAERRATGRYRTGRRVGIPNLRRYLATEDLRLFQRIEVPDRLSYYFNLLVDVSPSMLHFSNASKALAVAYAMTDALERLRVPVDVTLYSSAITVLHDHRRGVPDRFFGEGFGYLSAGTYEIEALAYAKLQADQVDEERKLIVVITDGRPNGAGLYSAGSRDLKAYYSETLLPWLRRAGIDVMAIGIEVYPTYHDDSVCITSGWQALNVLMQTLDRLVAEGERRHAALWR